MTLLETYAQLAEVPYQEIEDIIPISTSLGGQDLLSYVVPKLSPDGTCNASVGLEEIPYDLRNIFGITNEDEEQNIVSQIQELHSLLESVQQKLRTEWIGIYQIIAKQDGSKVLVKLAYQGVPSRAEFPVTPEFAELSNNTAVALSGKGIVIKSVKDYEGAYYKCDSKVNSEACLPIYNGDFTEIVGIVDAEAFEENYFENDKLALVTKLSQQLSDYLPITK